MVSTRQTTVSRTSGTFIGQLAKGKKPVKKKDKSKQQALIRERKKQYARKRREQIRKQPQLHELEKRKERERWKKRKAEGKVKTVRQMTDREKRARRKTVRARNKRYVTQKKSEQAARELEEREDDLNLTPMTQKTNDCSRRALLGRKRLKSNRRKSEREVVKLSKEIEVLKKECARNRKKMQRLREKLPQSPRTKLNRELRGHKSLTPELKKKVLFAEVMRKQVQSDCNFKSVKKRQLAYKIFSGFLIRHYHLQNYSGLSTKMLGKYKKVSPRTESENTNLDYERTARKKQISNRQEVKKFYLSEENSIECADKRAFKIQFGKKKLKMRKRYLKASLKDLYVSYCQSSPQPVSYGRFCLYRPFYIVPKDLQERDTDLCTKCKNVTLLIAGLQKAKAIEVGSTMSLVRSLCCQEKNEKCYQRACTECKQKEIPFSVCDDEEKIAKFSKWVRVTEERQSARGDPIKATRTIKKDMEASIKKMKEELAKDSENFLLHSFRECHQTTVLKKRRENLQEDNMFIWQDFSENYGCKHHIEVPSHYYGASREQVTLHTGIVYLNNSKHSFCTVSKSPWHDPAAILAHLEPIFKKYLTPNIKISHFQSDSPSTQYRNKTMFHLLSAYIPLMFPQIQKIVYNYTESGHGKGAPDGFGATVKTTADNAVKNGRDIASFDALVKVLKEKCVNIFIDTVSIEMIKKVKETIPKNLLAFKGTMDVHQLKWNRQSPKEIQFKAVSCYACNSAGECDHYKLQNSPFNFGKPNRKPVNATDKSKNGHRQTPINAEEPLKDSASGNSSVKAGEWVAVRYGAHWYPGLVEKVSARKTESTVDFLLKHETRDDLYLWPQQPDKQSVQFSNILYKITKAPQLVDRQHYTIPESQKITNIFLSKK